MADRRQRRTQRFGVSLRDEGQGAQCDMTIGPLPERALFLGVVRFRRKFGSPWSNHLLKYGSLAFVMFREEEFLFYGICADLRRPLEMVYANVWIHDASVAEFAKPKAEINIVVV